MVSRHPKAYKIQIIGKTLPNGEVTHPIKWVGHATYVKYKKAGKVLNLLDWTRTY
jgi:hypothetical protein